MDTAKGAPFRSGAGDDSLALKPNMAPGLIGKGLEKVVCMVGGGAVLQYWSSSASIRI